MRGARKRFKIDSFPESAFRCGDRDAVVCIDAILATTTIVTAVSQGRRTFPTTTAEGAHALANLVSDPLLAGSVDGKPIEGFDMTDSPAALAQGAEAARPLILVSSPGAQLIINTRGNPATYVACFRNMAATAELLVAQYERVALLAAGTDGGVRCEDQMVAARIGRRLVERGFEPEDLTTADVLQRWSGADISLVGWGKSAEGLRRAGQGEDLEFIMGRVDDLDLICRYEAGEVRALDRRGLRPLTRPGTTGPILSDPVLADVRRSEWGSAALEPVDAARAPQFPGVFMNVWKSGE